MNMEVHLTCATQEHTTRGGRDLKRRFCGILIESCYGYLEQLYLQGKPQKNQLCFVSGMKLFFVQKNVNSCGEKISFQHNFFRREYEGGDSVVTPTGKATKVGGGDEEEGKEENSVLLQAFLSSSAAAAATPYVMKKRETENQNRENPHLRDKVKGTNV